ncbi:MAG TPA: hypothetical protein VFS20_17165 [Longimicrobium sp.]|nr:hypothetical protein [Longimicrobium sp.]
MSDQPAIPAITVFPPFNPAPRRDEPAPEAAREQAPPAAGQPEPAAEAAAEPEPAASWDAPAAAPMPWDFEAPQPEAPAAGPAGELEIGDEDEDLPWLEVPTPRAAEGAADQELRAEDTPNFMDWMRTEDQPPPVEHTGEEDDTGAPPITDFVADAQPWAPEVENAADDWVPEQPAEPWKAPDTPGEEPWKAPDDAPGEPWKAPQDQPADGWEAPADTPAEQPWDAPPPAEESAWDAPAGVDVPEPELYDLPDVPPSRPATPWTDVEAPLFEAPDAGEEPEPAWELPAEPGAGNEARAWEPAAESTGAAPAAAAWTAPEGQLEPTPAGQAAAAPQADVSAAFAQVADRLQAIAGALRSDPAAFLAGAQGGGDPLALLVTGFVLGFQAGQGGNG